MTITYTLINRDVVGNRRVNYGQVTSSSGEGAYYINPALRIVDNVDVDTIPGGLSGDVLISFPTSFPALMASGYITVIVLSGNTVTWKAIGKV